MLVVALVIVIAAASGLVAVSQPAIGLAGAVLAVCAWYAWSRPIFGLALVSFVSFVALVPSQILPAVTLVKAFALLFVVIWLLQRGRSPSGRIPTAFIVSLAAFSVWTTPEPGVGGGSERGHRRGQPARTADRDRHGRHRGDAAPRRRRRWLPRRSSPAPRSPPAWDLSPASDRRGPAGRDRRRCQRARHRAGGGDRPGSPAAMRGHGTPRGDGGAGGRSAGQVALPAS